ncbi:MAG TPA: RNA-splicing ligase RtcB [Porphyromonadaceae bacterium]|nr:RNA-splicing ligase RtcB [Porphyromonadaceae bacterium]
MKSIKTNTGREVKIFAETFEHEAYDQVKRLANYPAYESSVIRIMPDSHAGKGCTVGTTMTITDKVTPNLVGVDIGCGMLTVELRDKNINCERLDQVIREKIPYGFNVHSKPRASFDFEKLHCAKYVGLERALLSIGSLGGGNHFIEIDYSGKDDKYYLVIHSGSRNLGANVCKYYQDLAFQGVNEMKKIRDELIARLKSEGREKEINDEIKKIKKPIVDKELVHLSGEYFDRYMNDMEIVQRFASLNRKTMADIIIREAGLSEACRFETIHNYIDFKRMILRKGAVSAEAGEKLLIPINMRDGSLICIGKGNPDWNYSAPHGAGRLMSRSKAKELLSMDEFTKSMDGIFTTSVNASTLDEAPMAYKSMEEISSAITDTVDIIDKIKPVYNFKATE